MFIRHASRQLAAYLDGELSVEKAVRVDRHLEECLRCRTEREQVQVGMSLLEHLPLTQPPEAVWIAIQAALPSHRGGGSLRLLEIRS